MGTQPPYTPGVALLDALEEWDLVMRQLNRSAETRKTYATAVRQLAKHRLDAGASTATDEVGAGAIREYLLDVLERTSPSTAVTRWGGLLAFFKWATAEGLAADNPMNAVDRPQQPQHLTPVLSDDDVRAMFATCDGSFDGVRDLALMRLLLTTGIRRSECAGVMLDDLDLKYQTIRVMGKGSRERLVHVEDGTTLALRRYLRVRRLHRCGGLANLWIGKSGALTGTGIQQILARRARRAGVDRAHPHAWRHAFAHRWLTAGGTEGALMAEAGWRSRQMLSRYAASAAGERARAEHARLGIGEGL